MTVPTGPRTRRRGTTLENAIFEAVISQLRTVGYADLTMESIAAAADTGKAALYRRWPTREDLVAAALCHALPKPADLPIQDSVREDLLTLLRFLRDAIELSNGAALQLVGAPAKRTGGLLHDLIKHQISRPCQELIHQALLRGVERGEVRPEAATPLVASVGPAILMHQHLTDRQKITDDFLSRVVAEIIVPMVRIV